MQPTTMPGATTRSARRSWRLCWTVSACWQSAARAFRASSSSGASGAARGRASPRSSWSDCPWTTARSPSWSSPSTPPPRSLQLLLSPTTQSSQPTPHWSTPTAHSWSTTRQSSTSAAVTSTSSGLRTQT
uniref:Putative secreted protein n=1 Tax=Ixodes ricinus TaxID=34613 RepID=A0A6B0URU5_IXORI